MQPHKFAVGQQVSVSPNRYGVLRHEAFEVARLLPQEHGTWQYRIKSVADGHERVVLESELLT